MPIMKTQPQPSDREVLAGLVERVTYQNADNGFCVIWVKARGHRDLVTVVGHAAVISAGRVDYGGCTSLPASVASRPGRKP
jgi:exodeoxyribonuclease V alpha subunit